MQWTECLRYEGCGDALIAKLAGASKQCRGCIMEDVLLNLQDGLSH